jgi:hypothetical protein
MDWKVEEGGGGVDDDLEATPGLHHALQLLIAAQRRGQRGEELVGGEFGFRLVVVDVVIDDHPPLGRLTRLTRAQHDADRLVLQILADVVHEVEAGAVGFHDDVEEHDGDVGLLGHQRPTFRCGIGGEDAQALPMQGVIVEGETGAFMDGRIVVDHRDRPGLGAWPAAVRGSSSTRWSTSSSSIIVKALASPSIGEPFSWAFSTSLDYDHPGTEGKPRRCRGFLERTSSAGVRRQRSARQRFEPIQPGSAPAAMTQRKRSEPG